MQWSPGEGAERRYWVEGHGQALPLPFLSSDPALLLGSPGLPGLPVMEGHGLGRAVGNHWVLIPPSHSDPL